MDRKKMTSVVAALAFLAGAGGGAAVGTYMHEPPPVVSTAQETATSCQSQPAMPYVLIAVQSEAKTLSDDDSREMWDVHRAQLGKEIDVYESFRCVFDKETKCSYSHGANTETATLEPSQSNDIGVVMTRAFADSGLIYARSIACSYVDGKTTCQVNGGKVVTADKIPPRTTVIDYVEISEDSAT